MTSFPRFRARLFLYNSKAIALSTSAKSRKRKRRKMGSYKNPLEAVPNGHFAPQNFKAPKNNVVRFYMNDTLFFIQMSLFSY